MDNETIDELKVVYVFNNEQQELNISANKIEHRNGWVLALYNDMVVGGVKDEYLKCFYLTRWWFKR